VIFERFEDKGLAHYSYAVGCEALRTVAIVDPRRDVDVYLSFAAGRGLRITHVLETHIHADFASGARELAERTGAELAVSGHDEGETFQVSFPHRDLRDGDEIEIGAARLRALHTPGHTPEHLSYLVFDGARSDVVPMLMLSGDFLFVGSLGRPDLLGEEQKRALAGRLFDSVREKLSVLPDGLEVHPAHGAGSMCGAGMSGRPMSTLGYERLANPYLDPALSREAFLAKILGNVPPFPPYYRRMKRVNSEGPRLLGEELPGRKRLPVEELRDLMEEGGVVIDLRDQIAFGGGHIPGAFGVGAGSDLSAWAAWVVPYDRPVALVTQAREQVDPAVRALVRVGLDDLRGYLDGGITAWTGVGLPLAEVPQIGACQLEESLQDGDRVTVVDVRTVSEWNAGHVEGAIHIPGGDLADRAGELPRDGRLAMICNSGYRSTVAASVLARRGFGNVVNVTGGMQAWRKAGLPVAR
jgi:hydroxyacylglutathione hydrolase